MKIYLNVFSLATRNCCYDSILNATHSQECNSNPENSIHKSANSYEKSKKAAKGVPPLNKKGFCSDEGVLVNVLPLE